MIVKQEPAFVMGVVQAVLGLAVAFGLGLSAEQVGALLAATAAVLSLVTRRMVSPVAATPATAPGSPVPAS